MRIAIDVSGALTGPSGMRCYTEQLVKALSTAAPKHHFVCFAAYWENFSPRSAFFFNLRSGNVSTLFIRRPQRLIRTVEERMGFVWQERWLRRQRIDLFHGAANLLPRLRSIPGVVTLHHLGGPLEVDSAERRFYYKELTNRSLRRASQIIAISEFSRQQAIQQLGIAPDKIHAIWEGAGAEIFNEPSDPATVERLGLGPYLLFVSAINKRKNLGRLVHAFHQLKVRREIPHRLVMVGRKHESFPQLAAEIADLHLSDEVVFLDGVDNKTLAALYRGAELFVYPSLMEGFGLPILEAMGCGTAVVAARASCLPEIADDAALLFDGPDATDLARKIDQVLSDRSLKQELIRKGLERVKRFSWEETARQTLAVYVRAAASHS